MSSFQAGLFDNDRRAHGTIYAVIASRGPLRGGSATIRRARWGSSLIDKLAAFLEKSPWQTRGRLDEAASCKHPREQAISTRMADGRQIEAFLRECLPCEGRGVRELRAFHDYIGKTEKFRRLRSSGGIPGIAGDEVAGFWGKEPLFSFRDIFMLCDPLCGKSPRRGDPNDARDKDLYWTQ